MATGDGLRWDLLARAGDNMVSTAAANADRDVQIVANAQRHREGLGQLLLQAQQNAFEQNQDINQQQKQSQVSAGIKDIMQNGGSTDDVAGFLMQSGLVDEGRELYKTNSDIRKATAETNETFSNTQMALEDRAMTKAFGTLIASPPEARQAIYSNMREYMNNKLGLNLPEQLTPDVLLSIGNIGAEKNKLYQSMLSSPEMMRTMGQGLLNTFTADGQDQLNTLVGQIVGGMQAEKQYERDMEQAKFGLEQQKFAAQMQDTQFNQSMDVAEHQRKINSDLRGPRSEATIQLIEYRDQLVASGAGPDQIDTIDAAIKARIEGSKQGNATNVSIVNPDTGKIDLTTMVSRDIEKQFEEIQNSRKDRVDVAGAMDAVRRLEGTGLATGPGFRARYAAMKWASYGADADSVKAKALEDARIVENAGAAFIKWGMAQQGRGFSDADMRWFQENGLSPDNHPAVNKAIADAMQAAYDRQDMYVDMLYEAEKRGITPGEFAREWREYEKTLGSAIPESSRKIVEGYKKGNNKQQPKTQQSRAQKQQNRLKELFQ